MQKQILLIEDNAARAERRRSRGEPVVVRLHRILGTKVKLVSELSYKSGSLKARPLGRASIALDLLGHTRRVLRRSLVVAGTVYGSNQMFVREILSRGLNAVCELRPSAVVELSRRLNGSRIPEARVRVLDLLRTAGWESLNVTMPQLGRKVPCRVADLGVIRLGPDSAARLFAVDIGGIDGFHPGMMIGVSTLKSASLHTAIRALYWVHWIRSVTRRQQRSTHRPPNVVGDSFPSNGNHTNCLQFRANIKLACRQDQILEKGGNHNVSGGSRALLAPTRAALNVVDLFAGAGGMGLGFLLAGHAKRCFNLLFSGEVDPVCARTLQCNHSYFARFCSTWARVPRGVTPLDLASRRSADVVAAIVRDAGGVDVLVAGPPCQGFSSANRNSWSSNNPHNRLVNVFLNHVEILSPAVFLMENVQGIVWTARDGSAATRPSVAEHVVKRMKAAGYLVFPKLLDAVWYGVPQYRTRFFVLGIHQDVGYRADDFDGWGPYPAPTHGPGTDHQYVTVREAIGDLPAIANGAQRDEIPYTEMSNQRTFLRLMRSHSPKEVITDHVASKHAEYVIERYKQIPAGGNWRNILHMMANYADVERTHSNIYRRLSWDEPSVTIGHYRKSMLVHPQQNRGLSLREATRLQSFPDWFRFAGAADGIEGALTHKQQQLANAVCPLVTKAIADFILGL